MSCFIIQQFIFNNAYIKYGLIIDIGFILFLYTNSRAAVTDSVF